MRGSTLALAIPCETPSQPAAGASVSGSSGGASDASCTSGAQLITRLVPDYTYSFESFRPLPQGTLVGSAAGSSTTSAGTGTGQPTGVAASITSATNQQQQQQQVLFIRLTMAWPGDTDGRSAIMFYGSGPMLGPGGSGGPGQHEDLPAGSALHADGRLELW